MANAKKAKKKKTDPLVVKGITAITTGKRGTAVRKAREKLARGKQAPGFRKAFKKEHGFEYPYETSQERQTRQRGQLKAGKKPTILKAGERRQAPKRPTRPVRRTGETRGAYGRRLAGYNKKITDWKSK